MLENYVACAEAAIRLQCSVKTVRRLIARHNILTRTERVIHGTGGHALLLVEFDSLAQIMGRSERPGVHGHESDESQVHGQVSGQAHGQVTDQVKTPSGGQDVRALKINSEGTWTGGVDGQAHGQVTDQLAPLSKPASTAITLHPSALLEPSMTASRSENIVLDPVQIAPKHLKTALEQEPALVKLYESFSSGSHDGKWQLLERLGKEQGVSGRTMLRRLEKYQRGGTTALARKRRTDSGSRRLPEALLKLTISLILTNPKASAARLRRIVELNDASALAYRVSPRSDRIARLSATTITRIRAWMQTEPTMRVALMQDKERKEFLRVWSGEVMSAHANDLWEADMTRCDTFVYDPPTDTIYRLRIHATIDIYTGCIPSFVFSRNEGQLEANRMLMLALKRKPEPWNTRWNVFGRPTRLYWDNGKTYRSERSHTALESLGVEIIHSKPRVSHSRGAIERFFGTFHRFEETLPGYGGFDTKQRDHEQLARLQFATREWLLSGADPSTDPYPNRLLLEDEYKRLALLWLTADYHKEIVHKGFTREMLFASSAPRETLVEYNFDDLGLLFSKRHTRTVRGNGTIALNGRAYGMPGGELMAYQNLSITVLEDDRMDTVALRAAIAENGNLRILGDLTEMTWRSDSDEAKAYRKNAKKYAQSVQERANQIAQEYNNPELRYERALEHASGLESLSITTPLKATPARIETDPDAALRLEIEAATQSFHERGLILDAPVDDLL